MRSLKQFLTESSNNSISNAKYLDVYFGDSFSPDMLENNFPGGPFYHTQEILDMYPSLEGERPDRDRDLWLRIDVETGQVVNWPKEQDIYPFDKVNKDCKFKDVKLSNYGFFVLTDKNGKILNSYQGYTPKCLRIEKPSAFYYSDAKNFINFIVRKTGKISKWSFTQEDFDELMQSKNAF